MKDFSKQMRNYLASNWDYQTALGIARDNSGGKIWLIGGGVYRTLLFGDCDQSKDFDFIVENEKENKVISFGWTVDSNHFSTCKFVGPSNEQIDLVPLERVIHIAKRGLEPSIENYLAHVPFNVHSIAYDVGRGEVVGNVGLEAIQQRVLRVNDLDMASAMAEKYGKSVETMMREKATQLDFDYEFPVI